MPRRRKRTTSREKVFAVIRFARGADLANIAAALNEAAALMPPDDTHRTGGLQRP
jgi:hypothetical protein